jgi:hypothetical protein
MSGLSAIFHADEPTADAFHAGHQLTLRSVVEPVELCESAAHADLTGRGVHEFDGDEPAGLPLVPRRNNKMGDRTSGRVDDQTANLAAGAIRAACPGPDGELRHLCHCHGPL